MYTGKKLQLEQGQKTESQGRANSKYETIQKSLVGGEGVGGRGDPHNRYEKMKIRLEGRLRSTDREKRRGQKNAWSTKLRQMRI